MTTTVITANYVYITTTATATATATRTRTTIVEGLGSRHHRSSFINHPTTNGTSTTAITFCPSIYHSKGVGRKGEECGEGEKGRDRHSGKEREWDLSDVPLVRMFVVITVQDEALHLMVVVVVIAVVMRWWWWRWRWRWRWRSCWCWCWWC